MNIVNIDLNHFPWLTNETSYDDFYLTIYFTVYSEGEFISYLQPLEIVTKSSWLSEQIKFGLYINISFLCWVLLDLPSLMLVELYWQEFSNSTSLYLKRYKLQHKMEYSLSLSMFLTSIISIQNLKLQSFNTSKRLKVPTRWLVIWKSPKSQSGLNFENQAVIFRLCSDFWTAEIFGPPTRTTTRTTTNSQLNSVDQNEILTMAGKNPIDIRKRSNTICQDKLKEQKVIKRDCSKQLTNCQTSSWCEKSPVSEQNSVWRKSISMFLWELRWCREKETATELTPAAQVSMPALNKII